MVTVLVLICRFKVLRHHPDKRRGAGEDIREDDDYFTCITKAFEQVSNPQNLCKQF
jgi:DnaJ family protein C protein 2